MDTETTAPSHTASVIAVHGFRTFGDWQDRLDDLLLKRLPHVEVRLFDYGFYGLVGFLFPPPRRRVIGRLVEVLRRHTNRWRGREITFVSHSFGTYVVAHALKEAGEELGLKNVRIITSGSVLPQDFDWQELREQGVVGQVINDCGTRDPWPLIAQLVAFGMGSGGRYGFTGDVGSAAGVYNRFFRFG